MFALIYNAINLCPTYININCAYLMFINYVCTLLEPLKINVTHDVEDFDEVYTLENFTISEPTLWSITMIPGEENVEYNNHLDVYRVEFNNTTYEDIKGTSSVMRMSTLNPYPQ